MVESNKLNFNLTKVQGKHLGRTLGLDQKRMLDP